MTSRSAFTNYYLLDNLVTTAVPLSIKQHLPLARSLLHTHARETAKFLSNSFSASQSIRCLFRLFATSATNPLPEHARAETLVHGKDELGRKRISAVASCHSYSSFAAPASLQDTAA